MRRLLTAVTLLLTVLACSPVAGGPTSKPDPRLGISVHESSAQVFGRAPDYGSGAHALRSRNSLALSPTGDAFVVITLDASRPFGSDDTQAAQTVVKKISPTGTVTALPAPKLGSNVYPANTWAKVALDGNPFIVDEMPPDNAYGRFVQISTFDGSAWHLTSFVRADRPADDAAPVWNTNESQLRVFDSSHMVIQHGNTLTRFDGTAWSAITLEPSVKEIRLGTGEGTRLRVWWVTTDNMFNTAILTREGTFEPTVTTLALTTPLKVGASYGFSGSLDAFFVTAATTTNLMHTLRFENNALTELPDRPPLQGEVEGKSYVAQLRDPTKGVLVTSTGALQAMVRGNITGTAGQILGFSGGTFVTCPADCTVKEGVPVATASGCEVCVPRSLILMAYALSLDATQLKMLFVDRDQDATMRFYLKSAPLPVTLTDITQEQTTSTPFPGAP